MRTVYSIQSVWYVVLVFPSISPKHLLWLLLKRGPWSKRIPSHRQYNSTEKGKEWGRFQPTLLMTAKDDQTSAFSYGLRRYHWTRKINPKDWKKNDLVFHLHSLISEKENEYSPDIVSFSSMIHTVQNVFLFVCLLLFVCLFSFHRRVCDCIETFRSMVERLLYCLTHPVYFV